MRRVLHMVRSVGRHHLVLVLLDYFALQLAGSLAIDRLGPFGHKIPTLHLLLLRLDEHSRYLFLLHFTEFLVLV